MSAWMEREIGKLEARMGHIEKDMQLLRKDVRESHDLLVSLRGGWRAAALLIAAISSLIAVFNAVPWEILTH